jgi:hypothetical protein
MTENRPTSKPESTESHRGLLGGIAAAFALVLCCAGPALIAGGVLSAIGGVVSNPFVVAAGVLIIIAAIGVTFQRHYRGKATCDPNAGATTRDPGTGIPR